MSSSHYLYEYTIRKTFDRPNFDEYKSYSNYPTATISDAMKKRNALPQNIKPVWGDSHHIYGTAVTVSASPGDEVLPLKAIDIARPGDVIIVANNVFPYKAFWGGNQNHQCELVVCSAAESLCYRPRP